MVPINSRCLSLITFYLYLTCAAERDFQFNDDLQVALAEPQDEIIKLNITGIKTPALDTATTSMINGGSGINDGINNFKAHRSKNFYSKEVQKCPYSESKIMLSLVLKSYDWKDIVENKKNRAINKLSKFFAIPKEYLKMESISRRDMHEMLKRSIKRGPNKCSTNRRLGKIEFMIGCGQSSYFSISDSIINQIAEQMKDGSIDEIAGIDFGWWIIWRKSISNRVQRLKRDAEGSGEYDYNEYDYADEDDEDGGVTDIPTTPTHAHRHHHGAPKDDEDGDDMTTDVEQETEIPNREDTLLDNSTISTQESSTAAPTTIATTLRSTPPATTSTTMAPSSEPANLIPIIKNRIPKLPVTAGKAFTFRVPEETFYDPEDLTNLKLELLDFSGNELKPNSWIQYNPLKREIYGMPIEDHVSHWQYKLVATDSGNDSVAETIDIAVQQYKGHRSVNHEISIGIKFNKKYSKNIDWQLQLLRGISESLNDQTNPSPIIVREVRQNQDPSFATFSYYNETLPKDVCPTAYQLNSIIEKLRSNLNDSMYPDLSIKTINYQLVGNCGERSHHVTTSAPLIPHITKNYSPVPRNQVDRVNATIGHLLVFKVPPDTFYDPEDTTDLKLSLLTMDRNELNPKHWLQFDSKNQEFYGIPKVADYGSEEYLLVAEDHEGLTATDALVVVVNHAPKREFSVYFKAKLGIRYEQFNAQMQRKFVERVARLFNDPSPQYIQVRSITQNHDSDETIVNFYNTTLHRQHNRCPEEEIEMVRSVWFSNSAILRDRAKKIIGNEFNLSSMQIIAMPILSCHSSDFGSIHRDIIPIKTEEANTTSTFKDDYILTFVLPAVIILLMILLASIIACVLHRRRLTGKMELGDEEERKSFRSKGIPVIFQDELDEKPEIGNKSPIILKDEKPPLLPPSYNSTNIDGDNDCDEYVPPPAVVVGNREIRGKSPVTPSYRKPPPYVSP